MPDQHAVHVIVLTGGRSSRMGGRHKPGIVVAGRSVIDRTLDAVWAAVPSAQVVIAGSDAGLSPDLGQRMTVVREDPPFSGPLAGVAAAVEALPSSKGVVLLLGGDLPFLSSATIDRLVTAAVAGADAVSCVDATGHLQYLCTAWQHEVLRDQIARVGDPSGVPLRALFAGVESELIECDPDELRDIDTPEDLARAVTTADGHPVPEALLAAVERFARQFGDDAISTLSPAQVSEILDFAREVEHSHPAASPVVAAFLAGQLFGARPDSSASDALQRAFEVVISESENPQVSSRHGAHTNDGGSTSGGE